jgi:hypothetical protein
MPVKKFRSVSDMEQPIWRKPGDPALYRTMAALWDLGHRTRTIRLRPGVRKFASIDDIDRSQIWIQDSRIR